MLRRCTAVLLLVCLVYGCQTNPENARRELGELGVRYNNDAFFQAVDNNDKLAVKLFIAAGWNRLSGIFGEIWGAKDLSLVIQALLSGQKDSSHLPTSCVSSISLFRIECAYRRGFVSKSP